MKLVKRLVGVAMLLLAGAVGCSSNSSSSAKNPDAPNPAEPDSPIKAVLQETGMLLQAHSAESAKPATRVEELQRFEVAFPGALAAIQDGRVKVVWGVAMPGEGEMAKQSNPTVIAYAANAPEQGGEVLLTNGQVRRMSAEELAAALKR
jgi:Zn-dependent protease with chaperone function